MFIRSLLVLGLLSIACSPMVPVADAGGVGGGSAGGGSAGGGSAAGGSAAGGSAAGGSAAGGSAAGGSAAGGSAGGGAPGCTPACGTGRTCCNGACVNTANDPNHCGRCDVRCDGATPYCGGTCQAPPCGIDAGSCSGGGSCCGSGCCGAGQLCCDPQGPVSGLPVCHTPTTQQPTCPQGCAPLCASDRAIKSDVAPVDEQAVLRRVGALPLSTWRYTNDASRARHLGPMAQDFREAFGLGDTDTGYYAVDAHGVSLASIKALYQLVQAQDARLRALEAENEKLKAAARVSGEAPRPPSPSSPPTAPTAPASRSSR